MPMDTKLLLSRSLQRACSVQRRTLQLQEWCRWSSGVCREKVCRVSGRIRNRKKS